MSSVNVWAELAHTTGRGKEAWSNKSLQFTNTAQEQPSEKDPVRPSLTNKQKKVLKRGFQFSLNTQTRTDRGSFCSFTSDLFKHKVLSPRLSSNLILFCFFYPTLLSLRILLVWGDTVRLMLFLLLCWSFSLSCAQCRSLWVRAPAQRLKQRKMFFIKLQREKRKRRERRERDVASGFHRTVPAGPLFSLKGGWMERKTRGTREMMLQASVKWCEMHWPTFF